MFTLFKIDNCFYCQVEQIRLNIPDTIPCAVQQWGGLIAINYKARSLGIKRFDTIPEALKKCPELKLLHVPTYPPNSDQFGYFENPNISSHKACLAPYRRASHLIFDLIGEFEGILQKASVDEVYLDVTKYINESIISELNDINFQFNLITSKDLGIFIQPNHPLNLSPNNLNFWLNYQLIKTSKLVKIIREKVENQLGFKCSAGISHNKLMSKIASGLNKPHQQTTIFYGSEMDLIKDYNISSLPLLGGKLGDLVKSNFGELVNGVRKFDIQNLQDKLGKDIGSFVYNQIRGINKDLVVNSSLIKSMMSAKSLRPPINQLNQLKCWLRILSAELLDRLNIDNDNNNNPPPNRWPKTLIINLTFISNNEPIKSKSLPFLNYFELNNPLESLLNLILNSLDFKNENLIKEICRISLMITGFQELNIQNGNISKFFIKNQKRDSKEENDIKFFEDEEDIDNLNSENEIYNNNNINKDTNNLFDINRIKDETIQIESNIKQEKCHQCNEFINIEDLLNHKDYHLAQQLQNEFEREQLFIDNKFKSTIKSNINSLNKPNETTKPIKKKAKKNDINNYFKKL